MNEQTAVAGMNCKACGNFNSGNFCKDCGEELHPQRFSLPKILRTFPDLFLDVDHGLLYTIKELFKNPGRAVRAYLNGDRARHYKPLKFVLFMSGLYALLFIYFNIHGVSESQYADIAEKAEADMLEQQTTELQSIVNLVSLPFLSLTSWLFFGPKKLYYGEHLLLNSYIIGFVLFIQIVLFPVMLIKNGTAWVDWILSAVLLFTVYFVNRTYYGLFYSTTSTANFLVCLGKSIAIILLFAFFQLIVNPVVIHLKIALFG